MKNHMQNPMFKNMIDQEMNKDVNNLSIWYTIQKKRLEEMRDSVLNLYNEKTLNLKIKDIEGIQESFLDTLENLDAKNKILNESKMHFFVNHKLL